MKILVLGASGRVGQKIAEQALADQHDVTAFVRTPEKLNMPDDSLTIFKGDVLNNNDLNRAMKEMDLVISALNTDKNNTLQRSMPGIVDAMKQNNISRIITIGTAGILNSRTEPDLYRFQSNESKRRKTTAAEDHLTAFHYLEKTDLDWTVVCPTYLPEGEAEGNYRVEKNALPEGGNRITVGDTANFTYSLINSEDFLKSRVGIAY
ncbi:NAD(P)-dependent oxidoreductase [Virgibacillus flavescens]|uniref:NAD(P)-dependent oxidoreductase n=1 Tax=Virgibacillus flavescens TaxID=1611422 RepID=UPI003D351043